MLCFANTFANINIEEFRKKEAQYKYNNLDSLIILANNTDTTLTEGKLLYNWYFSRVYYFQANYTEAFRFIKTAHRLSQQIDHDLLKAEIMLDYGYTLAQLDQQGDALLFFLKAKPIFDLKGTSYQKATFYIAFGDFYRRLKKLKRAEELIRKALQFNDLPLYTLARINHRLAAVKTELGQQDSSLYYSEKALVYAYKLNNPDLIAISENEKGYILIDKKKFDDALVHLKIADSIWTKNNYLEFAIRARLNIARTYRKMKLFAISNEVCLQNLDLCKEKNWITVELEFCEIINKNYKSLRLIELAKTYLIRKLELHVLVLEERQKVNTEFVELKFENEKYEAQIKEQQILRVKDKKELEQEKTLFKLFSFLGIGVILLISYFTYLLRKKKKIIEGEKNKLENYATILHLSLAEKNALLQEVNHRVKNNLQTISSILYLQSAILKDKTAIDTLDNVQRRIEAIALVHEMLYSSDNIGNISFKNYIEKLIDVNKPLYLTKVNNLLFEVNVPNVNFSVNICISLGMITNEAITNAVKHAFKKQKQPTIKITLKQNLNNNYSFVIHDNGSGINNNNKLKSTLGLRLMDIFARKIKGSLELSNNNGTTITINFTENE